MSSGLKTWIEAARPKTLAAAVVPVMVGTALAVAHRGVDWVNAMICLAFALLVQIGTNFANDYYDFVKGADAPGRVGPRRAVAAGLVAPAVMRNAMGLVFAAAFVVGLVLMFRFGGWGPDLRSSGGWILLPVGVVSIICGIAYTGGPYPLGYNGLGDIFVFVFFGLVAVNTTFFVQARHFSLDVICCAAVVGLLAANILVANNYRDAETDARAGKRTLVVRFGRKFAVWQYALSCGSAIACPIALMFLGYRWPVLCPLVLAVPAFVLTGRLARSKTPAEQIALLGATAALLAIYGVLLSVGVTLGR